MTAKTLPRHNYGYFYNYQEHVQQSAIKAKHKLVDFMDTDDSEIVSEVIKNIGSYCKPFDPLLDGYDYADEFFCASIVPLTLSVLSLAAVCYAVIESTNALTVKLGLAHDDGDFHGEYALFAIGAALVSAILAIISLIKSVISLVTRPIATILANEGYINEAEPDWRFADTDSFYYEFPTLR